MTEIDADETKQDIAELEDVIARYGMLKSCWILMENSSMW